ncbi:MAG: SRPBCC family protein [Gemmatimonadota bacterium]|nr:SRPBCC family protein [Gemmatimonadota bacterium]
MKTFRLQSEQRLDHPLGEVFGFFSRPENLERLTPPWLQFRILTPPPIEMGGGTLIDYRLRLKGFPIRWRSEITVWDPPHLFVDEQRVGPYRSWVHTHSFRADGESTVVMDSVEYAVPGGILVQRLFVRPDIERIFGYRAEVLPGLLSSS